MLEYDGKERELFGGESATTNNRMELIAVIEALTALKRPSKVVLHTELLTKVWGPEYRSENHYLKVYIGRLRDKLEDDAAQPRLIVNVRGVGYRLNSP